MTASLRHPYAVAALAVVAVLALFWPTFASMVAIWNRDATFTHGYMIPFLSLWLLWRDRAALAGQSIEPELRALWCIAVLLVVWLAADLATVQVLRQAAATALIPCVVWAILGSQWTRRALFALLYLFFAVPFGDFLVPALMNFTTEFTVAAVKLVGIPIYRDGTSFTLPSGDFEVIKACSGVRYLIATLALGTLFAALSYRSWRKRLAFMALCLVLPIGANGLRAFGIVMIAHFSNMKYAAGVDHLIYGWVFFGFVMLLLFWIGGKFADDVSDSEKAQPRVPSPVSFAPVAVVLLVIALAPLSAWAIKHGARDQAVNSQLHLASAEPWRGPTSVQDGWRPVFVKGGGVSAEYVAEHKRVRVFARHYPWQEQSNEATSAVIVDDGQLGWRLVSHSTNAGDVDVLEIFGPGQERWRMWRWFLIDGAKARNALHAKSLELNAWLRGRAPQASIVCVAVPMRDGDADQADAVLTAFTRDFSWRVVKL